MFSIVIPSYNRKTDLLKCLEELNKQTYFDFEVVVVDDCSEESISNYAHDQNYRFDLVVVRNKYNLGAAGSRNFGVASSKHQWILFLDDDDHFDINKCDIIKTHISISNAIFFYHPAKITMVNENVSYFTSPQRDRSLLTLNSLLKSNVIGGTPMWCISKPLFLELGGFDSSLMAVEDYEFLFRLVSRVPSSQIYYIDSPLTSCFYHTSRESVSKNIHNTMSAFEILRHKYYIDNHLLYACSSLDSLAHSHLMSLNRRASYYFFKRFLIEYRASDIMKSAISLISPSLLIKLRRFV